MKIVALLSADRRAPRDVYDLDLLLPPHIPLLEQHAVENLSEQS